jgi:hypothetical protein
MGMDFVLEFPPQQFCGAAKCLKIVVCSVAQIKNSHDEMDNGPVSGSGKGRK